MFYVEYLYHANTMSFIFAHLQYYLSDSEHSEQEIYYFRGIIEAFFFFNYFID